MTAPLRHRGRCLAAALLAAASVTACSAGSHPAATPLATASPTPVMSPSPPVAAAPSPLSPSVAPSSPPPPPPPVPTPRPVPSAGAAGRYVFPVVPLADVTFAHAHHDYPATDILATCGDSYRATTSGTIIGASLTDRWSPQANDGATRGGLSVTLLGVDSIRYYGSHLRQVAAGIGVGVHVTAGQELGLVGNSGDARGLPCHVHYGISPNCPIPGDWWNRRGVLYPWPFLESWRVGGQRSPVTAIAGLTPAVSCAPHPRTDP